MHRQYQPTVQRAPMLDPAYWSRKDSDTRARPQAMSTKILGLGVFLVGVLILSVGLIIGLEFPKYVRNKLIDDQCVLNKDHEKFQSWMKGYQWTRINRLYFWVIENKDGFLYNGEEPKMKERGPYVYREVMEKTNITFNVNEVWFNLKSTNVFDIDLTTSECGYDCKEYEELTVINPEFLRKTTMAGSEGNYDISQIPSSLSSNLLQLGINIQHNITDKLPALGCLNSSCDAHWSTQLPSTNHLQELSFGAWLRQNDSSFKSVILDDRGESSFTEEEMFGLYNILTTPALLRSDNLTHATICLAWWKQAAGASSNSVVIDRNPDCGVVPLLELFSQGKALGVQNVSAHLQPFLCSDSNPDYCFILPSSIEPLTAYIQAISTFILTHIASFVQETYISDLRKDLVTTRNQSDLVFGYYEDSPNSESTFVTGVFTDPWSGLGSNSQLSPLWTLSTCLQDRNINNNMMVRKISRSQYAPKSLLKDTSMNANLLGHSDFVASCGPLQACVTCQPKNSSPKMYIPALWRSVRFTSHYETSLFDNAVFRMYLTNDTFTNDVAYDVKDGVQNMTGLYSYLVWRSNPHFLYSTGYPSGMASGSSDDKHLSYIDVEPDTGRVWQRKYRTQFNVGVTSLNINAKRFKSLNVTYLDRPIPLFWLERSAIVSQDEVDHFNHKVGRLMRVSCGGVIGVSILAAIIMVIGIVLCILPPKTNRVAPVTNDSTLVNHHRILEDRSWLQNRQRATHAAA